MVFLSNKYQVNSSFLNDLIPYYAEAYSLDFNNEKAVNKMLSWIDQKVYDENYMNKESLQIDQYSAFFIMSTLYFDHKWFNSYDTKDSYIDKFKLSNKEAQIIGI